jgi:histidinol-phosphatase (PHP family)
MPALPYDYHTHSTFSCDARDTIDAMCRKALEIGLSEIAITDHLDMHPKDSCYNYYRMAEFHEALAAARKKYPSLTIRAGVEVGEMHRFHEAVMPGIDALPYDLIIGSLHWVGDDIVFEREYFDRRTRDQAAVDYFEEVARMVRFGGFNILGHLDVVRRYGAEYYGGLDVTPYQDAIRAVLRACIEGGIAIEINTSGLRRPIRETHPNLETLRWYREMGGELLTVGSDAHGTGYVASGFDQAREIALAAGFTRLCRFERRRLLDWVEIT